MSVNFKEGNKLIPVSGGGGGSANIAYGTTEQFNAQKESAPVGTTFLITDDVSGGRTVYDGNEHVIGTYHGKPLYANDMKFKLISGTHNYAHNIANIEECIKCNVNFIRADGTICGPYSDINGNNYKAVFNGMTSTFLELNVGPFFADGYCYIICEYTKTTD